MIFHYHNAPLYYHQTGKGPAMVFLHGFLESSNLWQTIVPHFESTHTVITLDFPGHGKSACIAKIHSMDLLADVLFKLLEHLSIKEAIFVGHSMGGYVLMALADMAPSKITSLILLNSTPAIDSPERLANRERALELVPKAKDTFISMAITNLFKESERIRYASEIEQLKNEAMAFPLAGILAAIEGMKDRHDTTHVLTNFTGEKHMIAAKEDPIVPFTVCKDIAIRTHTELHPIAGGHVSPIENSVKIVKILRLIVNKCI